MKIVKHVKEACDCTTKLWKLYDQTRPRMVAGSEVECDCGHHYGLARCTDTQDPESLEWVPKLHEKMIPEVPVERCSMACQVSKRHTFRGACEAQGSV